MIPVFPKTMTSLQPEDGGSMVLQNVGILPQHYMASQSRKPWLGWARFEFLAGALGLHLFAVMSRLAS